MSSAANEMPGGTPLQHNHSDAETAQAWLRSLINEWSRSQAASQHTSALPARLLSQLTQENWEKTSTVTKRTAAAQEESKTGYEETTKEHRNPQ